MIEVPITIGDDSDAYGNPWLRITLNTELDLTGSTARFQIGNPALVTVDFTTDIVKTKILDITLTKEDTIKLKPTRIPSALKLFDAEGKSLTVIKDIIIVASEKVVDNKG